MGSDLDPSRAGCIAHGTFFDDDGSTLLPPLAATSAASAGVGSAFPLPPAAPAESAAAHPALDPRFTRLTLASCPPFSFRRLGVLTGTGARVPRRPDAATLDEAVAVPEAGAAVERRVRPRMFLGWAAEEGAEADGREDSN